VDRLNEYRETIKRLLRERERLACPFLPAGLEVTCLFDDTSGQYALLSIGWMQSERVCGTTLLLRIKDGKIWVEEDATDAPIADDLVQTGIPRDDIVLGFHPPQMRACTAFAAA
jgi:XisI protein